MSGSLPVKQRQRDSYCKSCTSSQIFAFLTNRTKIWTNFYNFCQVTKVKAFYETIPFKFSRDLLKVE